MEKISRILPTNSRINSSPLEWKDSSDGSSSRAGRNILHSSKDLALQAHRELRGWRAKEARHSDIAEKIQTGFFSTPQEKAEPMMVEAPQVYTQDFLRGPDLMMRDDALTTSQLDPIAPSQLGSLAPSQSDTLATSDLDPLSAHDMDIENYIADVMAEAEAFKNQTGPTEQEEDWASYPKGSFLNIEV